MILLISVIQFSLRRYSYKFGEDFTNLIYTKDGVTEMANFKKRDHYFVQYPNTEPIEVSEKIYRIWTHGANKERAFRREYFVKTALNGNEYTSVPSRLVSIHEEYLEETLGDNTYNPQEILEKELQLESLAEALRHMPEHYRIVIHLIYFCDYTEAQVGEIVGIQQPSVHGRKERALRWLREYFKANGLHRDDFSMLL